jgi:hypothetical protein
MLPCFGMIGNCDIFSRWSTNFGKICTLSKKKNYSKFIVKKRYIGATIDNISKKFQNISFEKSSLWKHVSLTKGPPKGQ